MSDMKPNNQIDKLLVEESSEWIETLKRGNPEDTAAFSKWLLESRRHMRSFLMMTALDEELRHFDPERKHTISDLRGTGAEVVKLNERADMPPVASVPDSKSPGSDKAQSASPVSVASAGHRAISRWWSLAAMLAVFVGLAATAYWLPRNSGWQEIATATGEQRSIELADGSLMHLNTGSRVAVRLGDHTRDIRLLEGEALFKVHHDPTRPFRVHTLGTVIQAIGTQFNVYRQSDGATVSVLEGRVQIGGDASGASDAAEVSVPAGVTRLAAGEEARIDEKGRIQAESKADVERSTAWRQRRLIFKQDSLGTIVTEFNRYNRVPQFKLIGTRVSTRRYSGAFNVDDPESLSELLASEPDLLVQRSGDEILVRARLETGTFANSP